MVLKALVLKRGVGEEQKMGFWTIQHSGLSGPALRRNGHITPPKSSQGRRSNT